METFKRKDTLKTDVRNKQTNKEKNPVFPKKTTSFISLVLSKLLICLVLL